MSHIYSNITIQMITISNKLFFSQS